RGSCGSRRHSCPRPRARALPCAGPRRAALRFPRASGSGRRGSAVATRAISTACRAPGPATRMPMTTRRRGTRSRLQIASTRRSRAILSPIGSCLSRRRLLQLTHQRKDRLLQRLGGERTDLLVANDAHLVDDKRLGHAVDAEVDADAPVLIDDRQLVRIAVGGEPREPVSGLVLV